MNIVKCKCGLCESCKRRIRRKMAAMEDSALDRKVTFIRVECPPEKYFQSSLNLFSDFDLYDGRFPRNGRVTPKPALS